MVCEIEGLCFEFWSLGVVVDRERVWRLGYTTLAGLHFMTKCAGAAKWVNISNALFPYFPDLTNWTNVTLPLGAVQCRCKY